MPRQARKKSESGIYHVFIRGINRQNIFEDNEDNLMFLKTLEEFKEVSEYELIAYCLMGNHIHLLIRVIKDPLGQIMQRISSSYVYWYNNKYERVGNLFQDRFKSEPVDNDRYFLTALRYIHQNPCKAGIVKSVDEYKWSSYRYYTEDSRNLSKLVDVDFALQMFDEDRKKAIKYFIEHHLVWESEKCLDIDTSFRLSDKQAREIIHLLCKSKRASDLQTMDKKQRDVILKELKEKHNLSVRQIERLTGINRGVVLRA